MKRLQTILLMLIPCISLYGQINISDSTVSVSGHWNRGDNQTYIMQMSQTIDSEQLANVAYKYLTLVSESTGELPPEREDFQKFNNTTRVISWIHESGWLIYSIEMKVIKAGNMSIIEERRIEMQ